MFNKIRYRALESALISVNQWLKKTHFSHRFAQITLIFGSPVSRVKVFRNFVKSIIYTITPHLFWGICIQIQYSYDRLYREWHEWTNDTNIFHFSIRAIRLFVPFVIPKHLMPHRQAQRGCA